MNYFVLASIGLPLYALCFFATIFTVRTNPNLSVIKDESSERDQAILVHAHFLLLAAATLSFNILIRTNFFVWPFVAFVALTELLFQIPNKLSLPWGWIFRIAALLGIALELILFINEKH